MITSEVSFFVSRPQHQRRPRGDVHLNALRPVVPGNVLARMDLDLREQLSRVRGEIERLTAQRDHLGRLVSLATVLVIVRGTEAGAVTPGTPLGRYFRDACRRAWHGSLTFVADTVAFFINVLVGGLILWVLLVVIVLIIRRWQRRLRAAARHDRAMTSADRPTTRAG